MATGNEIEKQKPKASATAARARKKEVIGALNVEQGTDHALAYMSPFATFNLNGIGKNQDELLQEVMRPSGEEAGPTVRQLVAMRRMDGQARALYRILTLPIRAALRTSTIIAQDDGEDERDFIDQVFNTPPESGGMTVTFSRFMGQLLQGLFDGFSAFEKVFWVPEEGPLTGKITLKKLAHRPSETVTFVIDRTGGFAGMRQRTFYYGKNVDVFIPRNRAFYYAAQEEEQKYYGISFFQSAFYHFDKKSRVYYAAHLAANRAAVGTRLGTVPAGATKGAKAEFAQALGNLSMAQWLMMPEGFKVDVIQEGTNYDFLAQINHHNSQMSKSILAQFFDKDQGAGTGEASQVNFAQPGDEMFNLMLRAIQDDIADQINHYIIPQLIDFNFSGGRYPKFAWGSLTDEQNQAIAKTFDKIASQQTLTPEFIRALEEHQAKEFGLDIDYDEVDLREEEEAVAEAEMGAVGPDGLPLPAGAPGATPVQGLPALPAASTPGMGEDDTLPPQPTPPSSDAPADPAEPAGPVESPAAWNSLEDFEAAISASGDPDEQTEDDDFEAQLALSFVDEFENLLAFSANQEDESEGLLTMARELIDAAGGIHA